MEVKKNCPPLPPRPITPARAYPVLSAVEIAAVIEKNCGSFQAERHGKGRHYVFFLPEAAEELTMMVSYGRRSPMNHLEQKYIGLGHFFLEKDGRVRWTRFWSTGPVNTVWRATPTRIWVCSGPGRIAAAEKPGRPKRRCAFLCATPSAARCWPASAKTLRMPR